MILPYPNIGITKCMLYEKEMITPIFIQLALGKSHDRNTEQYQHVTYYSNTCWQCIKARTSFLYLQFFNVFSDWLQLWDKNSGQDLHFQHTANEYV